MLIPLSITDWDLGSSSTKEWISVRIVPIWTIWNLWLIYHILHISTSLSLDKIWILKSLFTKVVARGSYKQSNEMTQKYRIKKLIFKAWKAIINTKLWKGKYSQYLIGGTPNQVIKMIQRLKRRILRIYMLFHLREMHFWELIRRKVGKRGCWSTLVIKSKFMRKWIENKLKLQILISK